MYRMLFSLLILFALMLTACQASEEPSASDADEHETMVHENEKTAPDHSEEADYADNKQPSTENTDSQSSPNEPGEANTSDLSNQPADEPAANMDQDDGNNEVVTAPSRSTAEDLAEDVVMALSVMDTGALSDYVHPSEGLRFSPYSFVNTQDDLQFSASQVQGLSGDTTVYNWGYFDGTGDPIDMIYADYHERFVYDEDYLNPDQIVTNTRLGPGSSLDNSQQIYPNATVVEYHFDGFDPALMGMDWRSLRLVFEQDGNQDWWLIGIIHDEWTT